MRALMVLLLLAPGSLLAAEKSSDRQVAFGLKVAQKGLWQEARFRFERAVQIDPGNAAALNDLAVALEQMGEFEGARDEVRIRAAKAAQPIRSSVHGVVCSRMA